MLSTDDNGWMDRQIAFRFPAQVSVNVVLYFFLNREGKRPQQKDTTMEVEVCESEGVCDVLCNVPSDDPEQEESMETHEPSEDAAAAPSSETKPQYSYRSVSCVFNVFNFKVRFRLNSLSKTQTSRL